MSGVFEVRDTDRRRELLAAYESDDYEFIGQKPGGSDVEYFSPDTGFVLRRMLVSLDLSKSFMKRVKAVSTLSLGPKLELREFYYTLRQHPELVEAFDVAPESIYASVLNSINITEIVCDIDRDKFTIGNLSKGFIFDPNSWNFNKPDKKVGFTENIARDYMLEYELQGTQNIIVVEKMAAANRLVEMGLPALTNSCIVTTGGNFNRAIWSLVARFVGSKNIIFMVDADVYGDDMLRGIEFGTMNSCHLPYKFPPHRYPNIHLAGLWPSIAEELELPNDVEDKRPLNNPFAKKRLEFLERYNLIDQRDLDTWNRNKTYELEALSTSFTNEKQEPIGMGIYILEYMRRKNLPIKRPLPPDDQLKKDFDEAAWTEFRFEIEEAVQAQTPKQALINSIDAMLSAKEEEVTNEILEHYTPDYEACLKKVTAKEIKYHIYKQFQEDPTRKEYDLRAIAHKLKKEFNIKINMPETEVKEEIEGALQDYIDRLGDQLWSANVVLEAIRNQEVLDQNLYDLALKKLGADPEDVAKIRSAIESRFEA